MIIEWYKFQKDPFPLKLDTTNMRWIIIEDIKGRLCFISKTENIEFSIAKRNRNKWYKIYKNGKLITKSKDWELFVKQFF